MGGTCLKAKLCNACKNDTPSATSACDACYNWGSGTVGAKQLNGVLCSTAVANTVKDCKYYNTQITSTKAINDCAVCDGKTWLNITDHATAASIVITCSDTASVPASCSASVSNCKQRMCVTSSTGTSGYGCRQCDEGYTGSGTALVGLNNVVRYSSCTKTGAITNCNYHMVNNSANCYTCNSDYAVAAAATSCTSFTTDSNCRQLSSTWCHHCWHAYYFDNKKCILAAKLFALTGIVVAVLAFLN